MKENKDKSKIIEQYTATCFSLDAAKKELTSICLEQFVLNPNIQRLAHDIKELENEKKHLEDLMHGDE